MTKFSLFSKNTIFYNKIMSWSQFSNCTVIKACQNCYNRYWYDACLGRYINTCFWNEFHEYLVCCFIGVLILNLSQSLTVLNNKNLTKWRAVLLCRPDSIEKKQCRFSAQLRFCHLHSLCEFCLFVYIAEALAQYFRMYSLCA